MRTVAVVVVVLGVRSTSSGGRRGAFLCWLPPASGSGLRAPARCLLVEKIRLGMPSSTYVESTFSADCYKVVSQPVLLACLRKQYANEENVPRHVQHRSY